MRLTDGLVEWPDKYACATEDFEITGMNTVDPRAARSRAKMLDAVRDILMTEGAEAVTHQRVADVASVGRATVYRHWKSADDMVFALLDENPFRLLAVESGAPVEERLSNWLSWVTNLLADPQRRSVILHVLSRTDSDARANRLRGNRVAELLAHLDSALGDTYAWSKLSIFRKADGVMLLVGPLFMQVLLIGTAPSPERIDEVIERFLDWLRVQSPEESTTE